MGKIIAISNQKGGVGKTTTAVNLAAGLAELGKKVLLVDFDSQGNASQGTGAITRENQPTIYSVIMEKLPVDAAIAWNEKNGFDVLPANLSLAGADLEMDKLESGKEMLLKETLEPLREKYDFILIDCPPSLGLLNTNALTASDSVLIPVQCEYYALEGITQLLITIRLVQHTSNPSLRIEGILMTMYDIRTRLSVEVAQEVRQTFGRLVYQTSIPRNVKLSEAPSRGLSVLAYDTKCTGAKKYRELASEMMERAEKNGY